MQKIVEKLVASGDIYLGSYQGWYDEGQEEFVTETAAKEQQYRSAISGRPLVRYSEKTYFFRLSRYRDPLLEHFHVVHLHGNNYRPLIPGTSVPATLEGSFAHKALASGRPLPSGATYPIDGLDWPCNPERPDHPLTF